jgi:uncharacterized protein (DUF885 family)
MSLTRALLLATCLVIPVLAWAQTQAPTGNPLASAAAPLTTSAADARLKTLLEREWAWRLGEFGGDEELGVSAPDHLPQVDAATQQRRLAYWQTALRALDGIPEADLSAENRINAAVFRTSLDASVSQIRFREYEQPFGFWTWMAPRAGYRSVAEYRAYLGRLRDMPRHLGEQTGNLRAGLKRGFTPPRVAITGREAAILPLANGDVVANPLFLPFAKFPSSIPEAERAALEAEGRTGVAQAAAAFAKLHAFVRDEYIPHARTTTAAEALPEGEAFYRAKIREYTTTDLTPEQIYAIGEKEVARIDADMQATMRQAGWRGDFKSFLHFLKTDPQFTAKTPYELVAKSAYVANKAYGQLKFTVGMLPRYRFWIVPTPANIAPFATGGNGGLESCLMNTYDLPSRPLYTIPPLTLHECVPGHSFQAALALEGPDRPEIRKTTYFSGYGEGWALYMEWLGTKMGIYETPYEEFGRETYEMWRAARLVVDTGLHQKGWSRQQAIDFMAAHTALSDHEIRIEVDRYLTTPGQALAYKLGEMLIRRKRADAERILSASFDQRWFHDVILQLGSVPLPVLEATIDAWVAGGGKDPYAKSGLPQ